MATQIFVNLPVKDLRKATDFYTALGFTKNEMFSDENASCVVITDEIYAMLLTEPFFKGFTQKEIADATKANEAIIALGVESRQRVDELADKAAASGGGAGTHQPEQPDFMYSRSFSDPDGHLWELVYMDMSAMPAGGPNA